MDKKDVACIYNGILLSHDKKWDRDISIDMHRLMRRETAVQSEVSQKEKKKKVKYLLYVESRKMVQMNVFEKRK